MSEQTAKQIADQEMRYKAIVLKDPVAIEQLHQRVIGELFCEQAMKQVEK
jgi:hypothetical protein